VGLIGKKIFFEKEFGWSLGRGVVFLGVVLAMKMGFHVGRTRGKALWVPTLKK